MAPVEASAYLPPLDGCLEGGKQILSWQLACTSLTRDGRATDQDALRNFFDDARTVKALAHSLDARVATNPDSRAEFDTYTSAINISPNENKQYNVKELKEEALWLSEKVKTDEITALRIAVLEWQSRPAVSLRQQVFHGANLGLSASTRLRSSLLKSTNDPPLLDGHGSSNFDSQPSRRRRLLETWCREQQFQFKCLELVIIHTLEDTDQSSDDQVQISASNSSQLAPWRKIGRGILKTWDKISSASGQQHSWLYRTIEFLRSETEHIITGSGIFQEDAEYEGFQILWLETKALMLTHTLHIVLTTLQASSQLSSSEDFTSWLHYMNDVEYFESLEIPPMICNGELPYIMSSLSTMTTLALLNIPSALESLGDLAGVTSTGDDVEGKSYLYSAKAFEDATRLILDALGRGHAAAQPIALAWSIVLQEARERTQHSQDTRDHRLSQRAYDSLGQSQISDTESNDSTPHKTRLSANRRTSFGSDTSQQTTLLEYSIDCVQKIDAQDDVINLLARSSLHGPGAFGALTGLARRFCPMFGYGRDDSTEWRLRCLLLQMVEATLPHVQYGSDIVATTLAVLSNFQDDWLLYGAAAPEKLDIGNVFLSSKALVENMFEVAGSRFPFESMPFLGFCLALARSRMPETSDPFVLDHVKELHTYTTVVAEDSTRYDLLEDDPYYIELKAALNIFTAHGSAQPQQRLLLSNTPFQTSLPALLMITLPEGTRGATLTDHKPMIVRFDFKQSGFAYLGRIVQQSALTYSSSEKWNLETVLEPALQVISLMTRLLQQVTLDFPGSSEGQHRGISILDSFSEGLDGNADIVSSILEIFENELYEQHPVDGSIATEVLSQCTQFLHALLSIQPTRVWRFFGSSSFLGLDGIDSRFLGVIASQEMTTGQYPFLISSLHLFEALIDDVVGRSVSKNAVTTVITRFEPNNHSGNPAGIKDSLVAKIVFSCTKHIVDIFESVGKWKSTDSEGKMLIRSLLADAMRKLLSYCFDVDDNTKLSEKLTGSLTTSAEYLLDVFLSKSKNEIPLEPFIQILHDSLSTSSTTLFMRQERLLVSQTVSTIRFADCLIRINAFLGRPACRLEEQLFVCAEVLVRIFAIDERYKHHIIRLLLSMITGSSRELEQPPSLLGYLGQKPAQWFLDLLSTLGDPLHDVGYVIDVWKFLSAVVSQRQQWFAIYLLTGKTARSSLLEKGCKQESSTHVRSLLDIAITKLNRLDLLDPSEAASVLEFVALAADFWLWVPQRLEENATLMKELTRFLTDVNRERGKDDEKGAQRIQMAAAIANIFAMIIHRQNETGEVTFARLITPHLTYYLKEGVSTTDYNLSLHRALQKNFETKYPKCSISNFKKTAVRTPRLGRDFFYDLELANRILSFDKSWARQDGRGFLHEVERANLNLSLVQAQISLSVELAMALGANELLQRYMAEVIRMCLRSNQDTILPEGIFGKLAQSRADLAFVLLQRLIKVSPASKESRSILSTAWQTLRGHAPDLGLALTSPDANYDRTLTKIVYLALQGYLPNPQEDKEKDDHAKDLLSGPRLTSLVLDILGTCVAQGFRSLVSLLHEDPLKVEPTDFALLNAILRTALRIPNVDRQTEQLVGHFADNQTARFASTLFSWADQLVIDGDPIYGELSMDFLVSLSSVPALAETIVLGGILSQISASNLTKFFARAGGSGPFDQPTRVHVIWSRALLPLVINILRAIEAPIAGDVSTFLDQFKPQLERASQCLDPNPSRPASGNNKGRVTFNMASEVHSLAIISSIFDTLRSAGPAAGIAPEEVPRLFIETRVLRNDLENRLQRRGGLREDIVPTDAREEAWHRAKSSDPTANCDSLLEQRIVEELKGALALLGEQD